MNTHRPLTVCALCGALLLAPLAGCESLPGTSEQQGAVIGGVAGGAAGAVIADENRLLGALIGAAVGAVGGYLIGAQVDKVRDSDEEDRRDAIESVEQAQANPATVEDVRRATTADLNSDGFVTIDEVIAMSDAGLGDREILWRLEATNQIFELTTAQERTLLDAGVSEYVVSQLPQINQAERQRILDERSQRIGEPV